MFEKNSLKKVKKSENKFQKMNHFFKKKFQKKFQKISKMTKNTL